MSLSLVTATEPSKFLSKQAAEGKHHQNYPQLGKPRKRKKHFVLRCGKNKLLLLSVPTNIRLSCSKCLPISSSWFWPWYEPHWGLVCHQIGWEMSAVEEVGEDVQRSAAGMKAVWKTERKPHCCGESWLSATGWNGVTRFVGFDALMMSISSKEW